MAIPDAVPKSSEGTSATISETSDYGNVVRSLMRCATHCVLTAARRSGEHPDTMAGLADESIASAPRHVGEDSRAATLEGRPLAAAAMAVHDLMPDG